MPCRSGYDDEPNVIYRERKVYVTSKELQKELQQCREETKYYADKADQMVTERNKIKKELDAMTRAFCYVTNRMFDYDPEYLDSIIAVDGAVKAIFEAHQKLDREQGRSFLYRGVSGKLVRVKGRE